MIRLLYGNVLIHALWPRSEPPHTVGVHEIVLVRPQVEMRLGSEDASGPAKDDEHQDAPNACDQDECGNPPVEGKADVQVHLRSRTRSQTNQSFARLATGHSVVGEGGGEGGGLVQARAAAAAATATVVATATATVVAAARVAVSVAATAATVKAGGSGGDGGGGDGGGGDGGGGKGGGDGVATAMSVETAAWEAARAGAMVEATVGGRASGMDATRPAAMAARSAGEVMGEWCRAGTREWGMGGKEREVRQGSAMRGE